MNSEYRRQQVDKLIRNLQRSVNQIEFIEQIDGIEGGAGRGRTANPPTVAATSVSPNARGRSVSPTRTAPSPATQQRAAPSPATQQRAAPSPVVQQRAVQSGPVAQQSGPSINDQLSDSISRAKALIASTGNQSVDTSALEDGAGKIANQVKDVKQAMNNLIENLMKKQGDTSGAQRNVNQAAQNVADANQALLGLSNMLGGESKIVDLEFKL